MEFNDATQAQINAAEPGNSTWVTANAGSGKTRVLTDRVARLLLRNVPPQRILCLTYTKAAAAHMQNELFARLGKWAMLPDDDLKEALASLGEGITKTQDQLRQARTLFARALETPGGLKIQTIHSFCATLLRRFPLEAGVSPQFTEMDERSQRKLRGDIAEAMADHLAPDAFDAMARHVSGERLDKLMIEIATNRDAFRTRRDRASIWREFGLDTAYDQARYCAEVWKSGDEATISNLNAVLQEGGIKDGSLRDKLLSLSFASPDYRTLSVLEEAFVYGETKTNPHGPKSDRIPSAALRKTYPDIAGRAHEIMERLAEAKPRRQALAAAEKALALHKFAEAFLVEFDRRKSALGLLDFDDLVLRARDLLTTPGMADWVLFKLDGGIDHILVDEAQDTSPSQWHVIAAIAEEFFVGESARDVERTLFVVGDEKQSIYSFQGADPEVFADMRHKFGARLEAAQSRLDQGQLLFSFRSSAAILALVDRVRQDQDAAGPGDTLHRAFHGDLPGRVDLWPFLPASTSEDTGDWWDPVDQPRPDNPAIALAAGIARQIKELLVSGAVLPGKKGPRRITAGDFLVLVQRRSLIFGEIIRALKSEGLPVAGADRLKIGGELAVRDLKALLSFLATPEDDLSLAAALRSPLFGLGEDDLFRLAHGRKGFLWPELRADRARHPEALAVIDDLLRQADYLRPYELLERVLTRHDGRRNLVARLGTEAIDGIDAFLGQALDYERAENPSLTGFLGWTDQDETDIKRQMDTKSSEIRVMTVHGAKGLESPIVILPDTAYRKPPVPPQVLTHQSGMAMWSLPAKDQPREMAAAIAENQRFLKNERLRLLYVALTRAENWLIVCGCGDPGKAGDAWYPTIEQAMGGLASVAVDTVLGPGLRHSHGDWPSTKAGDLAAARGEPSALPGWANQPAPAVRSTPKPVLPSELGGDKIVDGAAEGLTGDAAKERGRRIHLLLEHLPGTANRAALAKGLLPGVPPEDIAELLGEASAIIDAPELAHLFSGTAMHEVGLTARFGDLPMTGVIDLLLIDGERVLAVDFKTNAVVPNAQSDVPEGLLRQMGAYRDALAQIYPGHTVETAILWTRTARLMPFDNDIVTKALVRATAS